MIIDFLKENDSNEYFTDVCIIGAGAAGITIANEFIGSSTRVLLVESGGFNFDLDTQNLYDVENTGIPRQLMILQRLRFFGGTTNHWDGRCAPLDSIDFEKRSWIPHSGWPISREELDPFYKRAYPICDLGEFIHNEKAAAQVSLPPFPFDTDELSRQTWQFSAPTRFGQKYKKELESANNITVLLHANVTELLTNESDSHMQEIKISSLTGRSGKVKAKFYILACGGLENPRLLLASNRFRPGGVGNPNDIVGRFFMEHLRTKYVAAPLGDSYTLNTVFNQYDTGLGDFLFGVRLSDKVQRNMKSGNGGVMAYTEGGGNSPTNTAFQVTKKLVKGEIPENISSDIINVLSDIDSIIVNARRHMLIPGSSPVERALMALVVETEQVPNPDSRISLSDSKDALGMPKGLVHWKLSKEDLQTTQSLVETLSKQLATNLNTRIRMPEWLTAEWSNWENQFRDVSHHMGTTRMSDDPQSGVVNSDCRMHAIDNLYIAGSSVFTTSGQVNPTLTIVSLALRLADHLKLNLVRS